MAGRLLVALVLSLVMSVSLVVGQADAAPSQSTYDNHYSHPHYYNVQYHYYTVQHGDTLHSIGYNYGITSDWDSRLT